MSSWRRRWQRMRRQNRFLVGLYLTLLLLVGAGFVIFARLRDVPPEELTNRLLLFLLWWFDLTLIAIVLFVLLRSFVKLALERRYGILGSRFRTKLLLSYLGLILVPTGLLFVLSTALLSQGSASWFTEPVEGMVRAGTELAAGQREESEARMRRAAALVARQVAARSGTIARVAEIERLHALLGTHLTGWFQDGATVVELVDARQRALQRLPALDLASGEPGLRHERAGGTVVVRAWEPLPDGSVVVVGEALPAELVEAQARLATAGAAYEKLKLDRPTVTATTVLGFGALALLVVFAAMWLGLYLSRSFTEPLLALVATTDRVAGGDTLEEVPLPAEDEVGLLVNSFNGMVRRLRAQEEELRSTVYRLDTVLGAIRTGVLTLDAGRDSLTANPAAAALLAMPQLAAGVHRLDELADAGLTRLVETIRNATGAVRGSHTIHPGGVARMLEVAVVPLGGDPPSGWVIALEDLSQLVRAQRQAAWAEVARRIAHQIKNPLTPIRLAAERMARHAERDAGDLHQIVPASCRAIVDQVQAMQEMVDAFSRYARFPALNRRPVPLTTLVAQVASLYEGLRPGVSLHVESCLGDREVLLDPEQFRQVLTNLLDNAVEASDEGGTVAVRIFDDAEEVVVEVADQGRGLAVDDPELLFQPFYSTKGRGSGVGLAIVQRIVADHGGTVRLMPNQPNGVRAVVRFPGTAA